MKFEFGLDDEKVLRLSGIGAGLYAAHAFVAPRHFHETWAAKEQVPNDAAWRWFGVGLGSAAAADLVIASSNAGSDATKNMLKTCATGWLVSAALTAYNAQEGIQKKDLSMAAAAGQAAMGALCLWRGLKESDD